MDNNMIHIDDLVRQRLRGGEEPERPGAWLTMRELLDKEMPVQAGYNWRRIIGYFTALLLLTTASVGGYRMYSSHEAATRIASGGGGRDGEGAYGMPSGIASDNNSSDPAQTVVSSEAVVATATPEVANQPSLNTNPLVAANNHSQSTNTTAPASHTTKLEEQAINDNQRPSIAQTAGIVAANNVSVQNNTSQPLQAQMSSSNVPQASASTAATFNGRRLQGTPAKIGRTDIQRLQTTPNSAAGSIANAPKPQPDIVRHDTIERLELVYHRVYDAGSQKMHYRIDTFPAGKIVIDRVLPSQPEVAMNDEPAKPRRGLLGRQRGNNAKVNGETPSLAVKQTAPSTSVPRTKLSLGAESTPVVPSANIASKTTEQELGTSLVELAKSRVSTKRFTLWDAEKVDAAINKFKFNLAKIQMYPGVMGGINASMFTPNALGGFQLGLTSLFVLNDWWSLMTEFKYVQRFNTGSSIRDNYMQVKDGSGQIQTTTYQGQQYLSYSWTDQTVQHSFNYDVVKTFELPLMLRYNWGRLYAQGGVNLVFSSAIAAKEVTNPMGDYKSHMELRPNVHTPDSFFITNDHPNVQISDFGSRFGTGYVISGGYMFSPAVYFDARITQTFWDNSKTVGAKQVSHDLLRTPSIQFSVGYRFNSTKTK